MSDKKVLLCALKRMLPWQFEEVIFHADIPSHLIVPGSQTMRAMEIIKYADSYRELAKLESVIQTVAPGVLKVCLEEAVLLNSAILEVPTNTDQNKGADKSLEKKISMPLKLFYSYSHTDEELRDKLAKHLKILQRQKVIDEWHDRAIEAGDDWENAIFKAMNEAQIILLLISSDFIASDYCWGKELEVSLQKHENGEARVIPIILRPVDWIGAPFSKLQALPKNAKPITTWDNIDEAMQNVAEGIRRIAANFQNSN